MAKQQSDSLGLPSSQTGASAQQRVALASPLSSPSESDLKNYHEVRGRQENYIQWLVVNTTQKLKRCPARVDLHDQLLKQAIAIDRKFPGAPGENAQLAYIEWLGWVDYAKDNNKNIDSARGYTNWLTRIQPKEMGSTKNI